MLMENEACVKEWDFGEGGGAALCKGTGKSGSLFRPSVNKKMLLKTIPKMEKNTLMKLLVRYPPTATLQRLLDPPAGCQKKKVPCAAGCRRLHGP